ncbi:hypothetical protein DRP53_00770 [candidate division WOR-3 bacterium]|uniref:Uncharacterized protein n=1 Tax=candidate division WOR-3 bacterium TaxID=2052148 RepID=A0A660SNU7_UNCW3|nr:MAG: hypothetical protein DRP53_00770 [candidate division WOR-3 bacterium]
MSCPFLEEVVVRYCNAYPVKKLIPASDYERTGICHGNFQECPIYKEWQSAIGEREDKMEEKLCIWAKLGVVSYRVCTQNYNCASCEFDQMMRSGRYGESALILQAMEKLKSLPADQRVCRYMLSGDISYKICSNNYECWHCEVDQMIQDRMEYHPAYRRRKRLYQQIKGIRLAPARAYTANHLWILKTGKDKVRVGIDDLAQSLLGSIRNFEFQNRRLMIETEKGKVMIPTNISGDRIEVNQVTKDQPEKINRDPYWNWLAEIRNPRYEVNLIEWEKAEEWLKKELEALEEFSRDEIGVAVSDGGKFSKSLLAQLDRQSWHRMVVRFLKGGEDN